MRMPRMSCAKKNIILPPKHRDINKFGKHNQNTAAARLKMAQIEPKSAYDPAILQDQLPLYYKRLFPHKPFYRWLSYSLCKFVYMIKIKP